MAKDSDLSSKSVSCNLLSETKDSLSFRTTPKTKIFSWQIESASG